MKTTLSDGLETGEDRSRETARTEVSVYQVARGKPKVVWYTMKHTKTIRDEREEEKEESQRAK